MSNDDGRRTSAAIPEWWVTAYALEELSSAERDRMAAAMSKDTSLRDAVEEARERAKGLREALLYHDAKENQAYGDRRTSRRRQVTWMALAALAFLALGSIVAVKSGWFEERVDTVLIAPGERDDWRSGWSQRMDATPSEPEVIGGANSDVASSPDDWNQPDHIGAQTSVFEEDGRMEVEGSLDVLSVRTYTKRYLSGVRWCYESRLAVKPELTGRMTLAFQIGPNGVVSSASVERSTFDDTELDECIVKKMARWRFPQPRDRGWVKVSYPIRLSGNDRSTKDTDED